MAKTKTGRLILAWDVSDIIDNEIGFRLEERKEEIESGDITEDAVRNLVYEDTDLFSFEWDCLLDNLSEILDRKNPDGYWKAVVNNFGWRSLDGQKYFRSHSASEFLREILPNTDCTFRVFNYGKGIAIQNFHHDSPVGREWYYITPCAHSTFLRLAA